MGAEPTPEQYVRNLVEIFREVQRVLRPDGILFLNLGDCYSGSSQQGGTGKETITGGKRNQRETMHAHRRSSSGLAPKQLIGIPWRVAFALQADGWYLRSEIIWEKSNCLPESVRDRPTRSHEQIFLLTKSPRYYYDMDSIREPFQTDTKENYPKRARVTGRGDQPSSTASTSGAQQDKSGGYPPSGSGRNARTVWRINTRPFSAKKLGFEDVDHFATFPPELIELCILAGSSEGGCCSECRTPFRRIVEQGEPDREWQRRCGGDDDGEYHGQAVKDYESVGAQNASDVKARILAGMRERKTIGWEKTCQCHTDEVVPCLVLDPFSGSGTTCLVSGRLGRKAIGIDLNSSYVAIAKERCKEFL